VIDQFWKITEALKAPKEAPPSTTSSGDTQTQSGINAGSGGNIVQIDEFRNDEFLEEA
jgi:hypothetical protein